MTKLNLLLKSELYQNTNHAVKAVALLVYFCVIIRKHLLFSLTVASFYGSTGFWIIRGFTGMSDALPPKFSFFLQTRVSFQQRFSSYHFSSCFWSVIDSFAVFLCYFGMKPLSRTSNGRRASVWFVLCFLEPLNHLRTNGTLWCLRDASGWKKKLQYVQFYKRKWTFHSWVFVLDEESMN